MKHMHGPDSVPQLPVWTPIPKDRTDKESALVSEQSGRAGGGNARLALYGIKVLTGQ